MAWVGFTDDELKRLRQQHGDAENKSTVNSTALKRAALNPATKRQRPREKLKTRTKGNAEARSREDGADVRRMTKMEAKTESCSSRAEHEEQRENSSPESDKSELPKHTRKKSSAERGTTSPVSAKTVETSEQESEASLDQPEVVIIEEPERIKALELSALEKMQQKQKEMEEENKRKAAALQAAIKTRYKKTQAETQTLTMVQQELSHLDNLLSADVRILRDQIDQACKDYLHAQKRYEKAETEFIAAKVNLHQNTERKELLTEHLYTVIQANEQRKAKKLETLMAKLNLTQDLIEKQMGVQCEGKDRDSGDREGKDRVSGDREGKDRVSGDREGKDRVSGDREGKDRVSGDREGKDRVSGDREGKERVSGDREGISGVCGGAVTEEKAPDSSNLNDTQEGSTPLLENSLNEGTNNVTNATLQSTVEPSPLGEEKDPGSGT